MRSLDFSSLHALLTTLLSLAVITLIGVGIRLVTQVTIQQRHERMNRQINERLRVLMAAYKTLGGSFTGDLTVDPAHRRDLHHTIAADPATSTPPLDLGTASTLGAADTPGADRARRVRDAVEAALSDIILLGTEDQVRLAAQAAHELATGKLVHTQALVISLRAFIRQALDLDPIPPDLVIPPQGPARPSAAGKPDKAEAGKGSGSSGGGGGMGGGGGGMGNSGMGLSSTSESTNEGESSSEEK